MKRKIGKKILYNLNGNPQIGEIVIVGKYNTIVKNIYLITKDILLESIGTTEFGEIDNNPHIVFVADTKKRVNTFYQKRIARRTEENRIDLSRQKSALDLIDRL